jgi:pimeloyl-ACP methyl ester carboxylesterase
VLTHRFAGWTHGQRIVGVSLGFCFSFEQCRRRIVDAVQAACPSDDPGWTLPVDVVGVSMGGLAARVAASPLTDAAGAPARRLNIVRLFTISSPLRGAILAERMPAWLEQIDPITLEMRPGSTLLTQLDESSQLYPIYSYVRLRDVQVGPAYAAAAGQTPWWLPVPPLAQTHADAFLDPRILGDIVRRLGGLPPLSRDPAARLP